MTLSRGFRTSHRGFSARVSGRATVSYPGTTMGGMTPPEPAGLTGLLARHQPPVAAVVRRVRRVALAAMPDLTERFLPGWQALALRHPGAGHLVAVFPRPGDVAVYFEHGAALADPHGLLTGTGRRTRMLVFTPGAAVPTDDQFVEYLDLALDHSLRR